jgi:poly(3-hydroxybutyrate) depolymerase
MNDYDDAGAVYNRGFSAGCRMSERDLAIMASAVREAVEVIEGLASQQVVQRYAEKLSYLRALGDTA